MGLQWGKVQKEGFISGWFQDGTPHGGGQLPTGWELRAVAESPGTFLWVSACTAWAPTQYGGEFLRE